MAGKFISVEVKGMDALLSKIKQLGAQGETIINKSVVETAIEAVSEMQRNTPVKTNRLRSSEHFELPETTTYQYSDSKGSIYNGKLYANLPKLSVAFGTNVDYAADVNYGTKPHTIKPINASALRFKIGGNYVFAKSVKHPGTKGYRFFEAGVKKAEDILPERLSINFEKVLNARG